MPDYLHSKRKKSFTLGGFGGSFFHTKSKKRKRRLSR